jgi:hypothetical protein
MRSYLYYPNNFLERLKTNQDAITVDILLAEN